MSIKKGNEDVQLRKATILTHKYESFTTKDG